MTYSLKTQSWSLYIRNSHSNEAKAMDESLARSNQSTLKETSPDYSLERLMLKLQYFVHLMWPADSLEKTLMLGKIEGKRRKGQKRMKWLDGITDSMEMLTKLQEMAEDRGARWTTVHGVAKSQTQLKETE